MLVAQCVPENYNLSGATCKRAAELQTNRFLRYPDIFHVLRDSQGT